MGPKWSSNSFSSLDIYLKESEILKYVLQTTECRRYAAGDSLATIVLAEDDSTVVAGPEIRVRGDFSSYHYTFHLDTGDKIAQVTCSPLAASESLYSTENVLT